MTTETRYIADVFDILTFRIECTKCGKVISYRPDTWNELQTELIPNRCTNCQQEWFNPAGDARKTRADDMLKLLKAVRNELRDSPMKIGFELERVDR